MEIKRNLRVIYKDNLVLVLSLISSLLLLATWFLFLVRKIDYSNLSVLHTNIYVGIDVLGSWHWLFLLPVGTILVSGINVLLSFYLWTRQRIWTYYLLSTTVFINFCVFFYLYNILYFNLK